MKREFHVGDRCRIRQWDDMAAEYGVTTFNDIATPDFYFINRMRSLCGKPFTISATGSFNTYISVEGTERRKDIDGTSWMITGEMLEFDIENDFEPESISVLFDSFF